MTGARRRSFAFHGASAESIYDNPNVKACLEAHIFSRELVGIIGDKILALANTLIDTGFLTQLREEKYPDLLKRIQSASEADIPQIIAEINRINAETTEICPNNTTTPKKTVQFSPGC